MSVISKRNDRRVLPVKDSEVHKYDLVYKKITISPKQVISRDGFVIGIETNEHREILYVMPGRKVVTLKNLLGAA